MVSFAYIEAEHWQLPKRGQIVAGDVFVCHRIKEEDRVIAVLSDGLGSGVKASVLANLTAAMALEFTSNFVDIKRSAETILNTLPVCSVRKIGYSTFTVVDIDGRGTTRIIEYDNPPCLLVRDGRAVSLERTGIALEQWENRTVHCSQFSAQLGDRIVFFTDGVSQAGLGERATPLGWGSGPVEEFVTRAVRQERNLPARALAESVVEQARTFDRDGPKDDITCGVIHFREPRRLLVLTGPPSSMAQDREVARMIDTFHGRKVIAGGTTANIVARHLNRKIHTHLHRADAELPPSASMDGVDLITEGTLTLGRVAALLESGPPPEALPRNPATELAGMLLASDVVQFVVGTRVNQAHRDPRVRAELELRRHVVKKIAAALETKFVKATHIQWV